MSRDENTLSPKHGVNPSMILCFWCGESKAVALCGRLPNDAEAPRQMVTDYDPCDKCQKLWENGIVLIGADTTPCHARQPKIGDTPNGEPLYPCGRLVIVPDETELRKIFSDDACDEIMKKKKAFIHPEALMRIIEVAKVGGSAVNLEDIPDETTE